MTRRRILITGASGYVGRHVIQRLINQEEDNDKYEIHALHSGAAEKEAPTFPPGIQVSALDLTDATPVAAFFKDNRFDVCLHLAALSSPRVCQNDPERAHAVNCPKAFFNALLHPTKDTTCKLVALSTDQVYDGEHAPYSDKNDDEDNSPQPINVYGQSKRAMEEYLLSKTTCDIVLLRSSLILGPVIPGVHSTFVQFCAQQARAGSRTDYFHDQIRSAISVDDVVQTLLRFANTDTDAGTTGSTQIYNMGGAIPASRVDIAQAVVEHLQLDNDDDKNNKNLIASVPQPSNDDVALPTPRNIAMDSSRLYEFMGSTTTPFLNLKEMVAAALKG